MDITQLDIELNTKAKETYKMILKKPNVEIIFGIPNIEENIIEVTTIREGSHNFILIKKIENTELMNINEKYYNLISKNIKTKLKKLTMNERKKLLTWKTWYLVFFTPFFGKRFEIYEETLTMYRLSYNSVVMDLTKLEYDRFLYYTRYVYKLQQLQRLNHELSIQQEFSIVFDDDKAANDLYKNMYDNFKGLIEPMNNNDLDLPDVDEEDDDN
jgi:hypothetical protein